MRQLPGIVGAFVAALCYGTASVLQAVGARRESDSAGLDPRLLVRLARQGPYLAGTALDLVGFLASIVALRTLPLFFVQAAVASSIGVTALLAARWLDARLARREVLVLAGLGAGLVLLAVAAEPEGATGASRPVQWGVLAGLALVVAVGTAAARSTSPWSASVLALGAGLSFGGVGIAARAIALPASWWRVVTEPLAWAIAGYGGLALLLFAVALQRGPVTTATAITFSVETVVPAAVGLLLLGDRARPGFAPVAGLGFVVTVGCAVALAVRAPEEDPTRR